MKPDFKIIGKWIKFYRMQKGLSQAQLGDIACVTQGHIANVESGDSSMSLELFLNICSALGVTPNDLIAGAVDIGASGNSGLSAYSTDDREHMVSMLQEAMKFMDYAKSSSQ